MRTVAATPLFCAVAFAVGVYSAQIRWSSHHTAFVALAIAIVLATWRRRRCGSGGIVAAALMWIFGGWATAEVRWNRDVPVAPLIRHPSRVCGVVTGAIDRHTFGLRFRLATRAGGVVLKVRGDASIRPGQHLCAHGILARAKRRTGLGLVDESVDFAVRDAVYSMAISATDIRVDARPLTPSLWWVADRIQRGALVTVTNYVDSSPGRAVLRATTLGDRGELTPETLDALRAAGVSHLLAVSGLHVAVVVSVVFFCVQRLGALCLVGALTPRRLAAGCALAAAVVFSMVTGARPSTLRALVVVAIWCVAVVLDRRISALNALGVAALVLLVHRPPLLWDVGCQLSFVATFALVLGASKLRKGWVGRLRSLLQATLWASLGTLPLSAWHFQEVATIGLVGNLLIAPMVEILVLPLGLVGIVLESICGMGGLLVRFAAGLCDAAVALAGVLAQLFPLRAVSRPSIFEIALWYLGLGLALVMFRRGMSWRKCAAIGVVAGVLSLLRVLPGAAPGDGDAMVVRLLDVGQGTSALIRFPDGHTVLCDAGGLPFLPRGAQDGLQVGSSPGRRVVVPALRALRVSTIDIAILSHPHPDHYLGFWALVDEIHVRELWVPRLAAPWPWELRRIVARLQERGTKIVHPRLMTRTRRGDIDIEVLAPRYVDDVASADPVMSLNDNSMVIRLRYGGRTVLVPGDIEEESEAIVAATQLGSDVVIVPHHGSNTSSTVPFVHSTAPKLAIVSCGRDNTFGFPSPTVVNRWLAEGAEVLSTHRDGEVEVRIGRDGSLRWSPGL